MEWISVKEKNPHIMGDYLCVFIGWDDMEFIRVLECEYDIKYNKLIWSDYKGYEYDTITHWMELPELPSENKSCSPMEHESGLTHSGECLICGKKS